MVIELAKRKAYLIWKQYSINKPENRAIDWDNWQQKKFVLPCLNSLLHVDFATCTDTRVNTCVKLSILLVQLRWNEFLTAKYLMKIFFQSIDSTSSIFPRLVQVFFYSICLINVHSILKKNTFISTSALVIDWQCSANISAYPCFRVVWKLFEIEYSVFTAYAYHFADIFEIFAIQRLSNRSKHNVIPC